MLAKEDHERSSMLALGHSAKINVSCDIKETVKNNTLTKLKPLREVYIVSCIYSEVTSADRVALPYLFCSCSNIRILLCGVLTLCGCCGRVSFLRLEEAMQKSKLLQAAS